MKRLILLALSIVLPASNLIGQEVVYSVRWVKGHLSPDGKAPVVTKLYSIENGVTNQVKMVWTDGWTNIQYLPDHCLIVVEYPQSVKTETNGWVAMSVYDLPESHRACRPKDVRVLPGHNGGSLEIEGIPSPLLSPNSGISRVSGAWHMHSDDWLDITPTP